MCCVKYLMIGCNSHSYVVWIKTYESLHFIDGFNVVFVALGIRASRPSLDSTASLLSRVKVCSWTLTL
jgi:hypothetical protein